MTLLTPQATGNGHPRWAHGFTMVELLVVMSIIALLIALLLPTLQNARDAARTIGGLSNQRQIMLGIITYSADYDDSFPPGQRSAFPWEWGVIINGYLRGETPTYTGMTNLFRDPNATFQRKYNHYSVHPRIMPDPAYNGGKPMRFEQMLRPTQTMTITDGTQQGSGVNYGYVQPRCWAVDGVFQPYNPVNAEKRINPGPNADTGGFPSAHIRFRQGGDDAANMAFVDGHAATMPMNEVRQKHVRLESP